jgi:hypothetical protein
LFIPVAVSLSRETYRLITTILLHLGVNFGVVNIVLSIDLTTVTFLSQCVRSLEHSKTSVQYDYPYGTQRRFKMKIRSYLIVLILYDSVISIKHSIKQIHSEAEGYMNFHSETSGLCEALL